MGEKKSQECCQSAEAQVTHCKAKVIEPRTLCECSSVIAPPSLTTGRLVVKVPVVLAERTIQVDVESMIRLECPALEIKRIRKNLFLTQCRLLPRVGKLFISGFVRKNIEYATASCVGDCAISGDIKHTTVNVPFECFARIPFTANPVINVNEAATELEIFDPHNIGRALREQDLESVENFNEKIFCELISARFNEVDIVDSGCPVHGFPEETIFQSTSHFEAVAVAADQSREHSTRCRKRMLRRRLKVK